MAKEKNQNNYIIPKDICIFFGAHHILFAH